MTHHIVIVKPTEGEYDGRMKRHQIELHNGRTVTLMATDVIDAIHRFKSALPDNERAIIVGVRLYE